MLADQIDADMKNAARAKDARRLGTIRMLKSQMKYREIEKGQALEDADVIAVIGSMIKQRKDSAAQSLSRKLHLTYPMIADPMNVIAAQFNVLGRNTLRARPAWFVVDKSGKVRALSREGLPERGYLRIACAALDLPSPDGTVTTGMP